MTARSRSEHLQRIHSSAPRSRNVSWTRSSKRTPSTCGNSDGLICASGTKRRAAASRSGEMRRPSTLSRVLRHPYRRDRLLPTLSEPCCPLPWLTGLSAQPDQADPRAPVDAPARTLAGSPSSCSPSWPESKSSAQSRPSTVYAALANGLPDVITAREPQAPAGDRPARPDRQDRARPLRRVQARRRDVRRDPRS